jgi:hypothetical protein
MKLLVMQFSPPSSHCNSLWSKYSPRHLVHRDNSLLTSSACYLLGPSLDLEGLPTSENTFPAVKRTNSIMRCKEINRTKHRKTLTGQKAVLWVLEAYEIILLSASQSTRPSDCLSLFKRKYDRVLPKFEALQDHIFVFVSPSFLQENFALNCCLCF